MIYDLHCTDDKVIWNNGTEHIVSLDDAFMAIEVNGYVQVCCGVNYSIDKIAYFTEYGDFVADYDFSTKILRSRNGARIKVEHIITIIPLNKIQGVVILTEYNTIVVCRPEGKSVELNAPYGITLMMLDIADDIIRVLCKDRFDSKVMYKYNLDENKLELE